VRHNEGIWRIGTRDSELCRSIRHGGNEMARMISPAGDMDVKIARISAVGNQLVITGQIGVWDSEIYFAPEEVCYLAKSMLSLSFLRYVVTLPFAYLRRKPDKPPQ